MILTHPLRHAISLCLSNALATVRVHALAANIRPACPLTCDSSAKGPPASVAHKLVVGRRAEPLATAAEVLVASTAEQALALGSKKGK